MFVCPGFLLPAFFDDPPHQFSVLLYILSALSNCYRNGYVSRMTDQSSDFPSVVFEPVSSASIVNLLDMQILRPYLRPIQSEAQGMESPSLF